MHHHIAIGGTIYLLADKHRIARIRPLLSLFAAELFAAAEAVALRTRHRRLPLPFIAVIDELRDGVTVPNLPYVANAQRKYGIGYVTSAQTASHEDAVYGTDAAALRAAAGVTIIGGIDIDSAREISDRAGPTPVVTPTRGDHRSEQLHHLDALTIADQQQLADGHAVFLARGLAPFLGHVPSIWDHRRVYRTITREAAAVVRRVKAASARDTAASRVDHATTPGAPDQTEGTTA